MENVVSLYKIKNKISNYRFFILQIIYLTHGASYICLAIYGPQCESLVSHLQMRMNKAEMLYFHSKLPDAERGTNSEHLGNVFVFMWAYKIKCTCFENNFCPLLSAKSQKNLNLPKTLGELQPFFVDVMVIALT